MSTDSEERDPDQWRIRRAEILARMQYESRACKLLRGTDSIAPTSTEMIAKLKEKFPSPKKGSESLNPVPENAPRFVLDLEDFIPLFRSAINSGPGGRTGLTGEHFTPLLTRPDVMTAL